MSRKLPKVSKGLKKQRAKQSQQKTIEVFWKLLNWLIISSQLFSEIELHGNIKWKAEEVAVQALIWSWMEAKNVTDAFDETLEICADLGLKNIANTYASFMNALTRYNAMFSDNLRNRFQSLAEQAGGKYFRTGRWVLIGFDGSRATAPRTVSNEAAFCAPNYGNGKRAKYGKKKSKGLRRKRNEQNKSTPQAPQAWVTLMWHMGLRLPWTWRLGPSNSSERDHVKEMLKKEEFPENPMFCGDAGFVGYPIWSSIINAGGDFLVRVGANVKLLSHHADVQKQGDGIVLCWPKGRMDSGDPPLRLRLVQVKVGKTEMWMLTSVLVRKQLSKKQIVRIYKIRWGIEVEFRGLKQTIDKHKLRCRKSQRLLVELDWSIRGMAIAELIATREQVSAADNQKTIRTNNDSYDPKDRSLAKTIRALRKCLKNRNKTFVPGTGLIGQLAKAKVQRYNNKTDKRARYRPKNPDKKPLGEPEVQKMNAEQRKKLKTFHQSVAA
jgi:hypothetical protein